MKKFVIAAGMFILAAGTMYAVSLAQETEPIIGPFTPEGYNYTLPEGESPESCLNCGHQLNYHLYRAVGLTEPNSASHTPAALQITGKGWLSSAHSQSVDEPANSNTYCAWCHQPTYEKVTSDNNEAKSIKAGNWHGMSCEACHTTHTLAAQFGTRYTNLIPGMDLEEAESYIPRHSEDGKDANNQCLFCHGTFHGFASKVKTALYESNAIRCIDCHMAGYQIAPSSTLVERYHNMKVVDNLPNSCSGKIGTLIACHSRVTKKWGLYVVPKILGAHTRGQRGLPGVD
jgi:Zn-finger protein